MDADAKPYTERRWEPPEQPLISRRDDVPSTGATPRRTADASPPVTIIATPFVWRDPATFPRRRWLYSHHLIRSFISCTVATGGVGKSSLVLVEALAMVTGRPLLGITPRERPLRVWVINLEDPQEEIERRVIAICLHYGIQRQEVEGRLFIDSGRRIKVVVAETTKAGTVISKPVVDALTAEIKARQVDVLVLDPFVKSHRVPENDNGAIDAVCTVFADIADTCDCAIDLVHHVRKTSGAEVTVEDGRGAVAMLGAVRSARVLNPMSVDEASKAGGVEAREFFRVTNGKANLAPRADKSDWFRLRSVSLGNGSGGPFDDSDHVQAVETWQWPDIMADVTVDHLRKVQAAVAAGHWRENVQSKDWVGLAVARVMGLDASNKAHRATIVESLKRWLASGMLVTVEGEDEKRMKRTYIEVGQLATD